jgi:hypothetical protein
MVSTNNLYLRGGGRFYAQGRGSMTKVHGVVGPKTFDKRDGKLGSHGNAASWPHRPDSERFPEMSLRKIRGGHH